MHTHYTYTEVFISITSAQCRIRKKNRVSIKADIYGKYGSNCLKLFQVDIQFTAGSPMRRDSQSITVKYLEFLTKKKLAPKPQLDGALSVDLLIQCCNYWAGENANLGRVEDGE